MKQSLRVVIVDQSSSRRNALKMVVERTPEMLCVGVFADLAEARERFSSLAADVVLLDEHLMQHGGPALPLGGGVPVPFVRIPPLDERTAEMLLRDASIADALHKIRLNDALASAVGYAEIIRRKIRVATQAPGTHIAMDVLPSHTADAILARQYNRAAKGEPVVIVGASTGGTEALREFLTALPASMPGVLVAQHMPEMFTGSFAQRLDSLCRVHVKEAEAGEPVRRGHVYIAPGHSHLLLASSGGHYTCELSKGPPVNRHRPSVDVLFRSAGNVAGPNAAGVILTGMGKDGAAGMLEMKQAGAYCFAQDEASCVVFGMPKEAIAMGAVDEVLSLRQIAPRLLTRLGLPQSVTMKE